MYNEKSVALKQAIEDNLFDNASALFCDGLDGNGRSYGKYSVQSQTLAVELGLMPLYHDSMFKKRILPFLMGEEIKAPVPSTYWTSYVLTAAREKGYHREVLDFIRRLWSPMIPYSTCSEVFSPGFEIGSLSHAWSAHPMFHLQQLLGGVVQESAAWDSIRYEPYFAPELNYVHVKVPTAKGVIESRWERMGGQVKLRLKLPDDLKARVVIPGYECEAVTGEFEHICSCPDCAKL